MCETRSAAVTLRWLVVAGALFGAVLLGGCGGGGNSASSEDVDAIQEQLDAIIVRLDGIGSRLDYHDEILERTQMLSGSVALENDDLVGLSAEAQAGTAIDPAWATRTERMLRSMQAVVWPEVDDIQTRAHAIEDALFSALDGLLADDLASAQTALAAAASGWTELRHEVFSYVAGPSADHGHSH